MKRALILGTVIALTSPVAAHAGGFSLDNVINAIPDVKPDTEAANTAKNLTSAPAKHAQRKQNSHAGIRNTKLPTQQQHTSVGEAPKSATIFDERPHKVEF